VDRVLKPEPLRQAIAGSIAANVKAYNVPTFCRQVGLPAGEDDSAWNSKSVYVTGLLQGWELPAMLEVAHRVLAQWDDEQLQELVAMAGAAVCAVTSRT
jgi:hypothetical protein